MSALPVTAPTVAPELQEYWDATADGRLLLPRCDACSAVFWYPRGICPQCGSLSVSYVEASGRGRIYSWTWNSRGEGDVREAGPYAIAYVERDEGPRGRTTLVDGDPSQLAVDLPVTVVFADTGEGTAILRFRPV